MAIDARCINLIIDSLESSFAVFFGSDLPRKLRLETIKKIPANLQTHIVNGITGDFVGNLVVSMSTNDSLLLGQKLMGTELKEHNEISVKVIKELLNITTSTFADQLSKEEKNISFTPPAFISGDKTDIIWGFPLVAVFFELQEIKFMLGLALDERSPKTVVVVDDSELLRISAAGILQLSGFKVIGLCATGKEALYQIEKLAPDIVLLDIEMPDISGIQVLESIRAKQIKSKVVMFTSINNSAIIKQATALGVDGYMLKPVNDKLIKLLRNL